MQYSLSGKVYLADEATLEKFSSTPRSKRWEVLKSLTPLHEAVEPLETEWRDTRSRSGRHGGLYVENVYELPEEAVVAWSFVVWRNGYPCEKEEGVSRVAELPRKVGLSYRGCEVYIERM